MESENFDTGVNVPLEEIPGKSWPGLEPVS
jgi:hypothetical protein